MKKSEMHEGKFYEDANHQVRQVIKIVNEMATFEVIHRGNATMFHSSVPAIGFTRTVKVSTMAGWARAEVNDPRIQEVAS